MPHASDHQPRADSVRQMLVVLINSREKPFEHQVEKHMIYIFIILSGATSCVKRNRVIYLRYSKKVSQWFYFQKNWLSKYNGHWLLSIYKNSENIDPMSLSWEIYWITSFNLNDLWDIDRRSDGEHLIHSPCTARARKVLIATHSGNINKGLLSMVTMGCCKWEARIQKKC